MKDKKATKQAKATANRHKNPSPVNGQVLPDGFEKHPERRHNGSWKKEDTLRYKLQQVAKMSDDELRALLSDEAAGEYEKNAARTILEMSYMDPEKRWKILEGLTNQDSGMPKQQVDQTTYEAPLPLSPRAIITEPQAPNPTVKRKTPKKKKCIKTPPRSKK